MNYLFALLLYAAALTLVAGLAFKIVQYARVPAPLRIPTMPAPLTRTGVAWRLAGEATLFQSLFKADKLLWLFAALFHFGLLAVLLRHLRYFTEPVWLPVALIQPLAVPFALVMMAGLALLLARRLVLPRIRYVSRPSDLLMLVLLLAIGASGMVLKGFARTDIVAVKAYCLGLLRLDVQPLPADPMLYLHLVLVAGLMAVFPFSKLLHVPGLFFSPSRNQIDDSRTRRHLAPWAARLDVGG